MSKIFYDVDTQKDFLNKDGALYVPDSESIKPNLKLLNDHAADNEIVVLSSVDRHFGTEKWRVYEGELRQWGGLFPDHCMAFTDGEDKIPETDPVIAVRIENEPPDRKRKFYSRVELDNMMHNTKTIKRAIFEKQSYSIFYTKECPGGNPFFESFLGYLNVEEVVVYGVATDYCVKAAVLGLRERGIGCIVVKDAIKGVAKHSTNNAIDDMRHAGARFARTRDMIR